MTHDERRSALLWAEAIKRRCGSAIDNSDLRDLDAAASMTLELLAELRKQEYANHVLAEANVLHRDREQRFSKLSQAFGMLEALAKKYVECLSCLRYDSTPGCISRHSAAATVLRDATLLGDEALRETIS